MTDGKDKSLRWQRGIVTVGAAVLMTAGVALAFAASGGPQSGEPVVRISSDRPVEATSSPSAAAPATATAPTTGRGDTSEAPPAVTPQAPRSSSPSPQGAELEQPISPDAGHEGETDGHETVKPRIRDEDDESDHGDDEESRTDSAPRYSQLSEQHGNDVQEGSDSPRP